MSHEAHEHGHTEDSEWRGLFAMAFIMPILASILGIVATQTAPAGPGPADARPAVHAASESGS